MYLNILSEEQFLQLKWLNLFKKDFMLVGGTAIALQLGHRRSIDFDLFKNKPFNKNQLKGIFKSNDIKFQLLHEDYDGLHILINDVKWTFFFYPFQIKAKLKFEEFIKTPSLITLAAMKAYALGRRLKWKDYVDLYVLLTNNFSIEEISKEAKGIFEEGFSEKLFRQQLSYFEGIDYSEPIEWVANPKTETEIKTALLEYAVI